MTAGVLFVSDSHLGLDLPARPRVDRPRRGDDLFESFERALAPLASGEAGILVHGGDLFYRSRVPAWLADRVYARLSALADDGVDVFWVPGNHERSGAPRGLLLDHPRVRVFERPRTFVLERAGVTLALSGFPFAPRVGRDFRELLAATGWSDAPAGARLLCIHQAVEGAAVGPVGWVFRAGDDVLPGREVPPGFAAVLSGHVHRPQVLTRDLAGRPLASPVLFAGSTDRVSFAERHEPKGAYLLKVAANGAPGGAASWEFRETPVRPMTVVEIDPVAPGFGPRLHGALAALAPGSLVRLRLTSAPAPEALPLLRASALGAAVPPGTSVNVAWPVRAPRERGPAGAPRGPGSRSAPPVAPRRGTIPGRRRA